jgi:hypothetical protein
MAGIYGTLNSRADFRRMLDRALATAKKGLAIDPNSTVAQLAARQLEAMRKWTDNGRSPTEDEQRRIDIGVLAARELSDTGRPETEEWAKQLKLLYNFFQGWPTDQQAASSTAADLLPLLEKIDNRRLHIGKGSDP